jgi:hypothetical protein
VGHDVTLPVEGGHGDLRLPEVQAEPATGGRRGVGDVLVDDADPDGPLAKPGPPNARPRLRRTEWAGSGNAKRAEGDHSRGGGARLYSATFSANAG